MADFQFYDYSAQVKAAIDGVATAWLHEWSNTIEAQAKRTTSTTGWTSSERTSLRDGYGHVVDEAAKEATVGNTLEQAFWEEYGTGEYADTAKNGGREGRKDWWVYIPGREKPMGEPESTHYANEQEARAAAAAISARHNVKAVASNGRQPNYTLEKAFISKKDKAKKDLQNKLKELDSK